MSMKTKKKRRYTDAFKRDAVKLSRLRGMSVAAVVRDLGINANSLYKWVSDAAAADPDNEEVSANEREELLRLRKENRGASGGARNLKKAAAFFAKESK
ncbi:MAG: transposase [bacterium]